MNIIIKDSKWEEKDKHLIFCNNIICECNQIKIIDSKTWEDLALQIQAYPSKTQARQAGRFGAIPIGYTERWINKKIKVFIWNPNKYIQDYYLPENDIKISKISFLDKIINLLKP